MNAEARKIIALLGLEPLPQEGGFFRQTWRGAGGSAIYFLLTIEDFSALHRLKADELWHFHAGDAVDHVMLVPGGGVPRITRLGGDVLAGEVPQLVVPLGVWQGARLADGGPRGPSTKPPPSPRVRRASRAGWALVGCTVTPAWKDDFSEMGKREALLREFPGAEVQIRALTR